MQKLGYFYFDVADFVSQEWASIHSIASFSEKNLPKWFFLPLGHLIRTRQMRPFCTGGEMTIPYRGFVGPHPDLLLRYPQVILFVAPLPARVLRYPLFRQPTTASLSA
jgi:hypothetical protein